MLFFLICVSVVVCAALYCEGVCRTSYELNKIYAEQNKTPDTNNNFRRKFWR